MKKLNQIFPIVLLAIILIISSCKKEEELVVDYFPLRVGNSWTYDMYHVNGNNETYSKTIVKSVTGTSTIGEHEFFEIETVSSTGSPATTIEYVRNDSGYYLDENGEFWIYLEGELNEVVSSTVESIPPGEILLENSVVSENESINVPVGTFNCLKYQTKITTTNLNFDWEAKYDDFYFAEGIGLVKYHNNYASAPSFQEYRLTDYSIVE